VHWTPDLAEAYIVEGLLRTHGLHAWAFDTATVRQDWFRTLAFGGYRVMAADADAGQALQLIAAWRAGDLGLAESEANLPDCTACHVPGGAEDRSPRRRIFLALIGVEVATAFALFLPYTSATFSLLMFAWLTPLGLAMPGLAGWMMHRRYRCVACGHAWREPGASGFHALARQVDAAIAAEQGGAHP
jgi:hypothetical protein